MTTDNFTAPRKDRSHKLAPRYVTWSAIAAPVLVLTGWAFIAAVPIALLLWGTWTDKRVRALRWWSGLTALLYAIPLVQYLLRTDPEASMSSMLHPAIGIAIALSAVVVVLKIFKNHRD
ncbi:hypothetical protein VW23_023325 [Devosia insulae DS-56]|uniref:Uncharacterized protein n=1 Tax=Devosia insulae DS-56 TaxID=1116389 RepID=A0A1E5XND0_9HYPH|nr:hypothetical protein [Devosia insulae]OEO30004.1 hypothetical protein VW23_023325 [Devosia insulae DS-56]